MLLASFSTAGSEQVAWSSLAGALGADSTQTPGPIFSRDLFLAPVASIVVAACDPNQSAENNSLRSGVASFQWQRQGLLDGQPEACNERLARGP
jgi:hypothetical protein